MSLRRREDGVRTRYSLEEKCGCCGLRRSRCVCARARAVDLPWELWVVRHRRERHKPSNTARLLVHAARGARLLEHGQQGQALSPEDFPCEGRRALVLFPSPRARVLDPGFLEECLSTPTRFYLLDGTWRQAGKMSRRLPVLKDLPQVALPLEEPSRWITRVATRPERLCTLECAWRLSRLAGHRVSAAGLEALYRLLLSGQRASRAQDRALPWTFEED